MSETKATRIRYKVEYPSRWNDEWFPKFFLTLEEAMSYTNRLPERFKRIRYRIHKETVIEELIEEGEKHGKSSN